MRKTTIIAEAGVNHNGSIETAKKLIDAAAEAGADYVKFQTFKTENLVAHDAPAAEYQKTNTGDEQLSQFQMLKRLELDLDTHYILQEYSQSKGIKFLSTAFDLDSIDLLEALDIDFYKIPSGEITNKPYIEKIASKGKPVIVSTGMSTMEEIGDAIEVLTKNGIRKDSITVLHCNTEYPTPMEDVHLHAMQSIAETFGVDIGYSDHTLGIEVPIAATALGAMVIEKHFTLDRNMPGPDHASSLEPLELKQMVRAIDNINQALGRSEKKPSPSEIKNRPIARKSIHSLRDLSAGHIILASDLIMKRPGTGISPMRIDEVIGKRLKESIKSNHILQLEDIM